MRPLSEIVGALLPVVQALMDERAAAELEKAADEYETDGAIVDALASQARNRNDLAAEAAYAITASDFQHLVGRIRARAAALRAATEGSPT